MSIAAVEIAAAIALAGATTHAVSLFDVFEYLCVETGADAQAALKRASARGWERAPRMLERAATAPSDKSEVVTDVDSRAVTDLNGSVGVYVANTNKMGRTLPRPARGCVVLGGPDLDHRSVVTQASAFAAVPPADGLAYQKGATAYLWREVDGRHVPVTVEEARTANDLRMMVVMAKGGAAVLQLLVPAGERN